MYAVYITDGKTKQTREIIFKIAKKPFLGIRDVWMKYKEVSDIWFTIFNLKNTYGEIHKFKKLHTGNPMVCVLFVCPTKKLHIEILVLTVLEGSGLKYL